MITKRGDFKAEEERNMAKKDLEQIRNDIDALDRELVELFKKRMDMSAEVAEYKKENNIPIMNGTREGEIYYKVSEQLGDEYEAYGRLLYSTIFEASRSHQSRLLSGGAEIGDKIEKALKETPEMFPKKAVVAIQGVAGSNSQTACNKLFDVPSIMYFNSFEGVFSAVEKGLCEYGILPIENSLYGSVGAVYDLMKDYDFHIVKSVRVHISNNLMAKPGTKLADIKEIYSHEQAIGQCGEFLKNLKGVKITTCENTALAAKMVAESDRTDVAAIAGKECLALYGLEAVQSDIQNTDNNYTRFICISKKMEIYPGANKISLILTVPHVPRSLYHTVAMFSTLGINLSKLESRPMVGNFSEYLFYFDIEESIYSKDLINVLCELETQPRLFVFLGAYTEIV